MRKLIWGGAVLTLGGAVAVYCAARYASRNPDSWAGRCARVASYLGTSYNPFLSVGHAARDHACCQMPPLVANKPERQPRPAEAEEACDAPEPIEVPFVEDPVDPIPENAPGGCGRQGEVGTPEAFEPPDLVMPGIVDIPGVMPYVPNAEADTDLGWFSWVHATLSEATYLDNSLVTQMPFAGDENGMTQPMPSINEEIPNCQEDPNYHRHYPGCPYTGPYSPPSVYPNLPAAPTPEATPPLKPKKVKRLLLNWIDLGEQCPVPRGIDTMEYRPSDGPPDLSWFLPY
jgi:hypothetical protein